jgi:hypothetical protein
MLVLVYVLKNASLPVSGVWCGQVIAGANSSAGAAVATGGSSGGGGGGGKGDGLFAASCLLHTAFALDAPKVRPFASRGERAPSPPLLLHSGSF